MTLKGKRIFVDIFLASLLAITAVLITVLVHSIGVLIAIPFIEAAIYALWHAKNVFFAEPSIEVNIYERSIPKVPAAKNSVKQDFKNEVWNRPEIKKSPFYFFRRKNKRDEGHQVPNPIPELN